MHCAPVVVAVDSPAASVVEVGFRQSELGEYVDRLAAGEAM
jgi:hypothetical protein